MKSRCSDHRTPTLVFKRPIKVYAGAGSFGCEAPEDAVILDLANNYGSPITVYGLPPLTLQPRIRIDWPDMGIPDLSPSAWRNLAKYLVKLQRPIFVACGHGHGRTGTALAILAALWNVPPKGTDPVTFIREAHCKKAVETTKQVEYIERVTGLDLKKIKPSHGTSYSGGPTSWGSTVYGGTSKGGGTQGGASLFPLSETRQDSPVREVQESRYFPKTSGISTAPIKLDTCGEGAPPWWKGVNDHACRCGRIEGHKTTMHRCDTCLAEWVNTAGGTPVTGGKPVSHKPIDPTPSDTFLD